MKKVYITPGCISCGTCESICPKVFVVKNIAEVKENIDLQENADLIKEAADICPVSVIKYEE